MVESPVTVAVTVLALPTPKDEGDCVILTVITGEAVTVATAVASVVPSFADVAVMATVPPVGTVAGAVYVVAAPLAVFVELKVPQLVEPQLQVTPALFTSLATVAVRLAVPDVAMSNADGDTDTAIGRIAIIGELANLVESATEVAVMVTVPHGGATLGAV
jgi:hypothetical protein